MVKPRIAAVNTECFEGVVRYFQRHYSRTSVIRPSVIRNLDYPIRAGSSIRLIRNTFLSGTHALTKESARVAESAFSFSCM